MRQDVQAWFTARTYTGDRWSPSQLLSRKGSLQVSVVLPARDDAAVVGHVVTRLRRHLMEEVPLVDELVVIDSGATAGTAAVAAAAGARVHRQAEILCPRGHAPGKGEVWWKSLAVTDGDVVVFLDGDLHDVDPRSVAGLLGPVLTDESVEFVTSCYDRPLAEGVTVMPAGGGRVTELVVRPLLNLFWPELAGIIQPMATECAGRRRVLEQVPFTCGEGAEVSLLIDVLQVAGLDAIAQVDLGERPHHSFDDADLGRMAAQIQLALQSRMDTNSTRVRTGAAETSLTQFLRSNDRFLPDTHPILLTERPPMIQVPEYTATGVSPPGKSPW